MTPKDEPPCLEGVQYATGEEWRRTTHSPRKNEAVRPKEKWHSVVDVSGDKSKIWCCKEQYCIGTWNVRSMNQGKLDVVKQEMVRININILGISELKWTGVGQFNPDDHISTTGGKNHRRNGVALIVSKSPKCSTWVQSQKWQNDLGLFPRQDIPYHSNSSLCPYNGCWRSEVDQFYEDLEDLLELTPKIKKMF